MQYKMRRAERELDRAQTLEVLEKCPFGVLSTVDEDGTPYGIPISYALDRASMRVYMHCAAAQGHNLANVGARPRACFTVMGGTKILPEQFSTAYSSVIATGNVRVAGEEEKRRGIELILRKLAPGFVPQGMAYIDEAFDRFEVLALDIEEVRGKRRPVNPPA